MTITVTDMFLDFDSVTTVTFHQLKYRYVVFHLINRIQVRNDGTFTRVPLTLKGVQVERSLPPPDVFLVIHNGHPVTPSLPRLPSTPVGCVIRTETRRRSDPVL